MPNIDARAAARSLPRSPPRQRRNDTQKQNFSKKRATLDCHSGPGRHPRYGISSVPAIRKAREQPCTDSGELRSQRRLHHAVLWLLGKRTSEEGKSASSLLCLWSGQHHSAWSLSHLLHPQTPRRGILRRLARGSIEKRRIYLSGLWRSRSMQAVNYSASPSAGRVSTFSHDLLVPEMPCQGGAHSDGAF